MPVIKSAKKRVRVANKAAIRNRKTKRALKGAVKTFQTTLASDKKKAATTLAQAQSAIDTATKKGVIHKNKAARQKRKLAAAAKAAGTGVAKGAAKAMAKTAPAKKPAAKNPETKKAPTKRPAAKKTAKK